MTGFFASGGFTAEDGRYGVPFANEFHGHHDAHGDDHDAEEEEAHDEDGDDHEEEIEIDLESHRRVGRFDMGLRNLSNSVIEGVRVALNVIDWNHDEMEVEEGIENVGTRFTNQILHPAGRRRSAADGPFLGQVRGLDPVPRLRGGRRRSAGPADRPDFLCRVRV